MSILVHAAILAVPMRDRIGEQLMKVDNQPPMSVVIVQSSLPPTPDATPPPPEPSPAPTPSPVPRPQPPRIMTKRPEPDSKAPKVPVPPPTPTPVPVPEKAPPVDMAALIEQRREQRRAFEQQALAAATRRDQGPQVPGSSSDAAIKRNLGSLAHGSEGTSGVFQILRKGERTAEFAFNGWKPDASKRWREVIEVDAGTGGDVDMAIIRRMIQLIRTHYTGDFNWESHRLGKTITLSARLEDQEGLEDFMSREFFGVPVLKRPKAIETAK
ncbi:hypothetical protein BWI17_00855 [Betaproteobacteria bacterium GR16-43]|nr:hypothetical protein BWI17_00855 [Betaproteobacteria bacterium GR16-43]